MAYKIVDATIVSSQLLYAQFKGYSILQNQAGYYEFAMFAIYMATTLTLITMAFFGAIQMWELLEEREEGAAEGFLGRAVAWDDAIRLWTLGSAVIVITYYAAYSIGETVDNAVTWIGNRVAKGNAECTASGGGTCDTTVGNAFATDLQFQLVPAVYSWFLNTFIMVVAHVGAQRYLGFKELEDCDLDGVDESYYSDVRSLIAQEVDIASCKNAVKQIFRIADLSGNGHIDSCENAKFLYGLGNSQKYALNFGEEKTLALLYAQVCYSRFSE